MISIGSDVTVALKMFWIFGQRNCAERSVSMSEGDNFGSLNMGLFLASFEESLLSQTSFFAQVENATYSVSVELRVMMDCHLGVQSIIALLFFI